MRRILFICYGNTCRSPMAEFVMKDLVQRRGLESEFAVASRGTGAGDSFSPVSPYARAELQKHGVGCSGKVSAQLQKGDYARYDLLIAMDAATVDGTLRIAGGDPEGKVHTMLEHTARGGDVSDPWGTQRYDVAYRDIRDGCESWLERLAPRWPAGE